MNAETVLAELVRFNFIGSAVAVLVLALRPLTRSRFGASVTYRLWILVPLVAVMDFLPERTRVVIAEPSAAISPAAEAVSPAAESLAPTGMEAGVEGPVTITAPSHAVPSLADALAIAWLVIAATLLAHSILGTRRLARDPTTGPALVGVLRPTLILPADFATRFDPQERALMLAHENVHRRSGHTVVNALVELARCVCWFNPLAHVAATHFRSDQELACDAAVIAAHPDARRAYAQALLKTHTNLAFVPLGCMWSSRGAARLHERISMLAQPALSRSGALGGSVAIAVLGLSLGYAAWAQQPERVVTQAAATATWTASAQAPAGTFSRALEGVSHDVFIDRAQKGEIDVVLFGALGNVPPAPGRSAREREIAGVKVVNFAAPGTGPQSLLWRLQNGELDGYQAKLVVLVLQTGVCRDRGAVFAGPARGFRELLRTHREPSMVNCDRILMEVATRQPGAQILLVSPERGVDDRTMLRELLMQSAGAAQLIAAANVYGNIGERAFLEDTGLDYDPQPGHPGFNGPGAELQRAAYAGFTEELQPWLDRFVR